MKTKDEVLVDGSDWKISLLKLMDSGIQDIEGYVSTEFGEPVFKISSIIFVNGSKFWVDGEHDIAYINSNDSTPMSEEQLNMLLPEE